MDKKSFFYFLTFFICFGVSAQEIPPVKVLSNFPYDAENQNWSISQNSKKIIYVANNNGLLEFNGARWKLYNSPNSTIIRSVKFINGLIYTGCYMNFGYWKPNAFGQLTYTSISDLIKDKILIDEEFWNIIEFNDWIVFQSLNRIYSYNITTNEVKIITTDDRLTKTVRVDDTIFYQKINKGLFKLINGVEVLVSNDKIIRDNILVNIFSHNNLLLIQTQNKGFYVLKENTLTQWEISSNSKLLNVSTYSSAKLKNNGFVIGTVANGVIFLKSNGDLDYSINKSNGISNNTVLSVFEDADNNVWLGLDNGVNCINVDSMFSFYEDKEGILGTIYTSAIFEDNLYLGTNQGLFYKQYKSNDKFKLVKGTLGQVWCLNVYDNTLFCGHNVGTFIIKNKKANLIPSTLGTWTIKPIKNLLIQGNYNGLNTLEKKGGNWQVKNKIEGFNISSKAITFLNDNTLFINHEYKGVYKLLLDDKLTKVKKIEKDSSVEKSLNSSLVKYENNIIYSYNKGVYKFNLKKNKFVKDSILSHIFNKESYITGKLIPDVKHRRLWGFSKNNISYVSQGQISNEQKINNIAISHRDSKMMVGNEHILNIEDETYLLGTTNGYVLVDLNKIKNSHYTIEINSIKNKSINDEIQQVEKLENKTFSNNLNNIEFSYNLPVYDKLSVTEYSYQLEGIYNNWSDWSTNSKVVFKNLPNGSYTFNVKARIGYNESQNTASFSFKIDKPFYLTNIMLVLYVLAILLFSVLMHNLYKQYYKKQKKKLIEKNKRELELKSLEAEQAHMQFENEKLQQDMVSKNRELAISTMSLIKKNQFLNNIKKELKDVKHSTELKQVIKVIDKDLNNTDDWKFFQEAFNNADKDFLKKIKACHTSLTPNDLRLCAYLRLNLSSKEIAPLLNISPKSVEVKRYRLRKKMNLSQKTNLTNYILEI